MSDVSSEIEMLNNKVDRLLDLISILVKLDTHLYKLADFCSELGISKYKLKKIYITHKLPITSPYRANGKDSSFLSQELEYMKTWLRK